METYGRSRITKHDDRLIAIAGIANSFQPLMGCPYIVGLWFKDLPYNLAWHLVNVEGSEQKQPQKFLSEGYRCGYLHCTADFYLTPL